MGNKSKMSVEIRLTDICKGFRDEKIRNDAKTSGQEGTFAGCFERMTFIPNDGLSTETLETIQKFTINEGLVDAL
jgi:hypothetical protein